MRRTNKIVRKKQIIHSTALCCCYKINFSVLNDVYIYVSFYFSTYIKDNTQKKISDILHLIFVFCLNIYIVQHSMWFWTNNLWNDWHFEWMIKSINFCFVKIIVNSIMMTKFKISLGGFESEANHLILI